MKHATLTVIYEEKSYDKVNPLIAETNFRGLLNNT